MLFVVFSFLKRYYLTKIKKKKAALPVCKVLRKPLKTQNLRSHKYRRQAGEILTKSQGTEYLIDNFESLDLTILLMILKWVVVMCFLQWWTQLVLYVTQHLRTTLSIPSICSQAQPSGRHRDIQYLFSCMGVSCRQFLEQNNCKPTKFGRKTSKEALYQKLIFCKLNIKLTPVNLKFSLSVKFHKIIMS